MPALDQLPGFRRRFRITPADGRVCSEVEDDYHCMSIVVHHAGGVATQLEACMHRAPWTTCPGAVEELRKTFTGEPLEGFPERGRKTANCTHLYDLALLAAAHAADAGPLVYDVLVSDPVAGERRAQVRRNGEPVLGWSERGSRFTAPAELLGMDLLSMRKWIESLDPTLQEPARLLRWGNLMANGRSIPLAEQSDAASMPPNCYTFQPERAILARRVGEIRDFSRGFARPLDGSGTSL